MVETKIWDCPATAFETKCRKDGCPEWVHITGKNPQGGDVDHFDCARRWMPVLLVNVANEVRQAAAAVESFRNEIAKGDLSRIDSTEQLVGELRTALLTRREPIQVERPDGFFRRLLRP